MRRTGVLLALIAAMVFFACGRPAVQPDSGASPEGERGDRTYDSFAAPPGTGEGYFPDELRGDFDWCTNILYALEEPSLHALTEAGGDRVFTCRLLYLPSFEPPVSVRVMIDTEELSGVLFYKSCALDKGLEPGELQADDVYRLSADQCEAIVHLFAQCDFWYRNPTKKSDGLDGAIWIVEGVQGARYHAVERWSADSEIYPIGIYLLELSGRVHTIY